MAQECELRRAGGALADDRPLAPERLAGVGARGSEREDPGAPCLHGCRLRSGERELDLLLQLVRPQRGSGRGVVEVPGAAVALDALDEEVEARSGAEVGSADLELEALQILAPPD